MSSAAQTARMVLRAPEARTPAAIRRPSVAQRAARAAAAVPVSQPQEPAEREAERVAQRALALPPRAASAAARRLGAALPARGAAPAGTTAGAPALPPALGLSAASGRPLPAAVRRDMEPRFGADFSGVRVHSDESAARASRRIQAAAFTVGNHVFFGRGRYQPQAEGGRRLLAHELTHTIQQRGATQQAAPIARMPEVAVREHSAPRVQRLGVQDALDFFADKAAYLPGFTMLTLLLGFNPINLREVPRTVANLLRALIRMLPGGTLVTQALDNHGIVERVAAWAEAQLSTLGDIGASIRESIDAFLDSLSWSDILDLGGVWERARRIVTGPIDRIVAFGSTLLGGIVDFVKDAILRPIGRLAEGTRGYPLLRAVLGFDPVTGDAVPRDAATLIGGFMTLIGQQQVWANIQRANAIPRAWAWFQGAVSGYLGFVTQIPSQFLQAFRSLELVDIILVPRAFARIAGVFLSLYGRFFSWALGTVISLLEIIIEAVAPGALPYLRQAGAAFQSILRNPIGFGMNLVRAAKAGLMRFAGNFLVHLQAGLIDWLTGSLPGVHIPRALSLPEILRFVMSVLGLTWANLRAKLVRQVGEPAVVAMEKGFEIVVTLVRDGPVAAWEQMKDSLAELKQMAIQGIVEMVVQMVVVRALPKLIALFIPGPGFITAAIAIWDTIVTFIRQLGRIAALVKSYLDAIIAIASGNIDAAAQRVEAAAARYLSLIISILAGIVGFGKVSTRVQAVLERIRRPIDAALDRVVNWVVGMARKVGRFVAQAGVPSDPNARLRLAARAAIAAARALRGRVTASLLQSALRAIGIRYALTSIEPFQREGRWWVRVAINPTLIEDLGVHDEAPSVVGATSGTKAQAIALLDKITSADQVSQALVDLKAEEPEILARYKGSAEGYLLYLSGKKPGDTFDWPLDYLRRRASFKKGKAIEAYWINRVLHTSKNNKQFKVLRLGKWIPVIPDIVSGGSVGDAKDWKDLSFTEQLRAIYTIAKASSHPGEVLDADDKPVKWDKRFVLIVRSKSHSEGQTTISGPLEAHADAIYFRITDKDVK